METPSQTINKGIGEKRMGHGIAVAIMRMEIHLVMPTIVNVKSIALLNHVVCFQQLSPFKRQKQAIQSMLQYLFDKEETLLRIFWPPKHCI
jgi:hypothetical protein